MELINIYADCKWFRARIEGNNLIITLYILKRGVSLEKIIRLNIDNPKVKKEIERLIQWKNL